MKRERNELKITLNFNDDGCGDDILFLMPLIWLSDNRQRLILDRTISILISITLRL